MRWVTLLFLFAGSLFGQNQLHLKKHAITYDASGLGARLGDKLLVYSQARYLSYITDLPFLWQSFPYGEKLQIHYAALPYNDHVHRFRKTERINSAKALSEFFCKIRDPAALPTLFVLEHSPSDISEWEGDKNRSYLFNLPWQDKRFKSYLQQSLVPLIEIPNLRKEGLLNVAVHVRSMSGLDTLESATIGFPLKLPSTSYHKRQIRRVYELNLKRPMYVFLFTDGKNPQDLVREFKESFREENIEFATQNLPNADIDYVTHDLFAMQKFDVLIATQSNFSMMAWRLGDLDLVLYPVHAQGVYPHSEIDRVQMISKKSAWFPYELNAVLKESL